MNAPFGVGCRHCGAKFRSGATWDKCTACRYNALEALDPEEAATATFTADAAEPWEPSWKPALIGEAARACGFDVFEQVDYAARSLERAISAVPNGSSTLYLAWRIEQRCPICRIGIANTFRADAIPSVAALFHEMFELFDEHRCYVPGDRAGELRARAERASERLAERAVVLRAREAAEPPRGPSLYERAERESVVFAEWAARFT